MSIATPHGASDRQPEEADVQQALELIQSTPEAIVERVLLRNHSPGFLNSLTRVMGFANAVESLSGALASLDTVVPPAVARAAQATENVWRQIDAEFGLLSSAEVAELLGASGSNRGYSSALRKRGALAGIERKNAYLYPGFQFDVQARKIRPWVSPLLALATQHDRSASDAVIWMVAPSTFFDGARPADHPDDGERILAGAVRSWDAEW